MSNKRDYEAERLEWARLEAPLPHAPGGQPPPLRFSLFPPPIIGGARSKAGDELIAKHVGVRPRRRGVDRMLDDLGIEPKRRHHTDELPQERQPENPGVD